MLSRVGSEESSCGRILKDILEVFGTTGIKIGQFLAASEILPDEDSRILRQLQERASVPDRESIYEDLRDISNGKELPVKLKELLGSASLKYAPLALYEGTGDEVVLKSLDLRAWLIQVLNLTSLRLCRSILWKIRQKIRTSKSIVRAAKDAVKRELSFEDEVKKSRS